MKHPEFYNVVVSAEGVGDTGFTHEAGSEVRVIVHAPNKEYGNDEALVDISISELVEMVEQLKHK